MTDEGRPHDTDPAVADPAVAETESDPIPPTVAAAPGALAAADAGQQPARTPRAIRQGDVLGRYEIGDELGEGGMATVFRARDRELRRDVAVKVLFPHLARRAEVVRRFHREARAAAGLEHPNILRIYDVGGGEASTDPKARGEVDPPFIVMELIRGRTLLQEIEQRGPILAELVACIGALLADALGAAHAAGIIHRDLKPSNVLLAQGGRLLLADFGVARLETEDSLVTRTGALLGTPAYMSPEQASGDTATARSDLYSLGATLYQLSTGVLPYSGSPAKVMSAIAAGQLVAPIRRRASVGPDLSRAIEHMMQTEAQDRPANAAQVAAELRRIAAQGGLGDPAEELAAFEGDPERFVRDKTPTVVGAIVQSAVRAVAEEKLPRALALADRASALAPEDPSVVALVQSVTEGGRAKGRRRALLLAGAGLLAAGGATAGAVALTRGGSEPEPVVAAPADAAEVPGDAPPAVPGAPDAAGAVALAVPDAAAPPADAPAARPPSRDAGALARRALDAPAAAVLADAAAAPALALDAAAAAASAAPDAPPALGTLQVKNDTWCDLTINDDDHGRITQTKTVQLPPGHYIVRCRQPNTTLAWRREVDVQANQLAVVSESMIPDVDVVIATSGDRVTIDGTTAPRGATVRFKPGQRRVIVLRGGKELLAGWVTIPRVTSCRLHEVEGRLVCDP